MKIAGALSTRGTRVRPSPGFVPGKTSRLPAGRRAIDRLRRAALSAAAAGLAASAMVSAQARRAIPMADSSSRPAAFTPGYLGVDIVDVEAGQAPALKLKAARGALITLIDHDAPAGQAGLRINDVVLSLDGQAIEDADQFRRILKGLPAGRTVTLGISRGGIPQTMAIKLVDRRLMEQRVWRRLGEASSSVPAMGFLAGDSMPQGFRLPSFGSALKVGALVEPLTAQMAAALGVESGLMVKQVVRRSEAARSGLRAFDVILKVGADSIATSADWDRALRANQGEPVEVIILRNKKQQTLLLQVDSRHQKSEIEPEDWLGSEERELMSSLFV